MVAAMPIYPYPREAIGDVSERIGFHVTLPVVRRGVIEFNVSDS